MLFSHAHVHKSCCIFFKTSELSVSFWKQLLSTVFAQNTAEMLKLSGAEVVGSLGVSSVEVIC